MKSSPGARGALLSLQAVHMGVACPCASMKQQGVRRLAPRYGWVGGTQLINLFLQRSAPTHSLQWGVGTSSGSLECFFSLDIPEVLFQRRAIVAYASSLAVVDITSSY